MLSEEGSEAANKDIKKFENDHSFESSPLRRLTDTFNRLIRRSDPIIQVFHIQLYDLHDYIECIKIFRKI